MTRSRLSAGLALVLCAQLAPLQGLQYGPSEAVSAPAECAHGHADLSARVHGRIDTLAPESADPREVLWLCAVCHYVGSWRRDGWIWTYHSEDPYSFYSPLGFLLEEFPFAYARAHRAPYYSQLRNAERVERETVYFNSDATLEELLDLVFEYLEPTDLTVELAGVSSRRISLRAYDDYFGPPSSDHLLFVTVDCARYYPKCYVSLSRQWAPVPRYLREGEDPDSVAGLGPFPARRLGPRPSPVTRKTAELALRERRAALRRQESREAGSKFSRPRAVKRPMRVPPESRNWPAGSVRFEVLVLATGRPGDIRCLSEDEVLCSGLAEGLVDWRFEPATKDGIRVDAFFEFTVRWQK